MSGATSGFVPKGVWTALVTPFRESGGVDGDALKRLVNFQVEQGVQGVVPCGTTGESPAFSWQEHDDVIERTVRTVDGRGGVLAGTGSNNTTEAIRGTAHAHGAGADGALLVDCYYNGPSSLELRTQYYGRVMDAVPGIPLVPYVIPGRTGCALSEVDLAVLHHQAPERVPAVKEATGDLARMRRTRELCGEGFGVLSGDDDLTLTMMGDEGIRADGLISVMSNLFPGAMVGMVQAMSTGDVARARGIEESLKPVLGCVGVAVESEREVPGVGVVPVQDKFRNPVPVKTMMAGLGMVPPTVRSPLGRMTAPGVQVVRDALRAVHVSRPEWFSPIETTFEVNVIERLGDDAIWSSLVG